MGHRLVRYLVGRGHGPVVPKLGDVQGDRFGRMVHYQRKVQHYAGCHHGHADHLHLRRGRQVDRAKRKFCRHLERTVGLDQDKDR